MHCQIGEPSATHPHHAHNSAVEKTIADQRLKINQLIDRLNTMNQVLVQRNKLLSAAYYKIKQLEEALRGKTLQWQELHGVVQNAEKALQDSTSLVQKREAEVQTLKTRMQLLQEKVMLEKFASRAFRAEINRLECRLAGKPEPPKKLTPELKLYQMMEDVKNTAEVYGEDSKECKLKQKQLDRQLETMADDAKRKAEAENAKHRAKEAEAAKLEAKEGEDATQRNSP